MKICTTNLASKVILKVILNGEFKKLEYYVFIILPSRSHSMLTILYECLANCLTHA